VQQKSSSSNSSRGIGTTATAKRYQKTRYTAQASIGNSCFCCNRPSSSGSQAGRQLPCYAMLLPQQQLALQKQMKPLLLLLPLQLTLWPLFHGHYTCRCCSCCSSSCHLPLLPVLMRWLIMEKTQQQQPQRAERHAVMASCYFGAHHCCIPRPQ